MKLGVYLKDEGGYEIVLKSLNHYKKRLRTIGNSPELRLISHVWNNTATRSHEDNTKNR